MPGSARPNRKPPAHSPFAGEIDDANLWLKTFIELAGIRGDKDLARNLFGAGLHALRDRLPEAVAIHLGAQLPTLIRGLYFEDWNLKKTPRKERHKKSFLDHIDDAVAANKSDPERIARATFGVLRDRIDAGEVAKVVQHLPRELQQLW